MRHVVLGAWCVLMVACGEPADERVAATGLNAFVEFGAQYVADDPFRRDALQRSLVNPANGYSRLRLERYNEAYWGSLPERNFAVRAVTTADFGALSDAPTMRTVGDFEPVFDRTTFTWSHEALLDLGRRAFHRYPLELTNRFAPAMRDEAAADEHGVWRHGEDVGGFVRARVGDQEMFATTCATCHVAVRDGAPIEGAANAALRNSSEWGAGTADVTADGVVNPAAIPDLRPVQHQRRLHWAATLYNSPAALAVRVETLMITSTNEKMRPPREVAVALAYYLWWLGEEVREPARGTAGEAVFAQQCGICHGVEDAVSLQTVGTDPAVGESSMRGTGEYRVPSLYAVGSRTQLLHEGKIDSLRELLDPARLSVVAGHPYGLNLSEADREALLSYLVTL